MRRALASAMVGHKEFKVFQWGQLSGACMEFTSSIVLACFSLGVSRAMWCLR
ncbi:hypothetical protein Scep_009201 [Stephania cephalantha]|uniref:Uncharacterized protein n=1 Tax=Stephania cephalantha TaxID=152367 RepID=A0AAP0JTN6_9MAGN